ncbi:MarR family winged helix-turn-helix transcriptional regulator [Novipirellula caenicola]|uniref:HTH marR-type domain-containing protein n=1 Tax=Novipirellula caenicola TaxID=1536901 RepID=A0ABP9VTZ1_9BACT
MATRNLSRELKKKKPFESVEQEAMLSVMRTSDLLENRLARLLRQYALTPSQYNAMRIMRGEAKPMPCLEIAERMIQVAPAITRVVDQLVDRQLVAKEQSSEDRRVFLVHLTTAGKSLLRKIDTPIEQLHRTLLGHVPAAELKSLITTLARARQGIPD